MEPRILLVEDDADLREVMAAALAADGHAVDMAADGHAALEAIARTAHEIVLLDIALGAGPDGVEVCRRVRFVDSDVYVMMLTARDTEADVVLALEAGADDYVTKPFQVKEITARLRALRRRTRPRDDGSEASSMVLSDDADGLVVLRPTEGRVLRDGEQLPLTRTEFHLLCELAEAHGQVLSRRQLLERVWEHGFFGDERLVDVHIRRLRRKVEINPSDPRLIVTVRGLGYRLESHRPESHRPESHRLESHRLESH